MKFAEIFYKEKPLIVMIHKGHMQGENMLETAKR